MIASLLLGALASGGGENRLWYVELELGGPCDELRLDCGPDGETRLLGPFLAGEERHLVVAVPVRSPLGAGGLAAVPLPRAESVPAGAARVRGLRWSPEQPAARLEALAASLLARSRPPVSAAPPRSSRAEILVVLVAGGLLLAVRKRLALAAPVALIAAALALVLARSRSASPSVVRLVEWEPGSLALAVTVAADELPLPRERLEVTPAALRLEFRVPGSSSRRGSAIARGARLTAVESLEEPALRPENNAWKALASAWTRGARGGWTDHGPWALGEGLDRSGPARAPGPEPPGWLASGLAPGRGVLLGRTEQGEWVRCQGFELE